MEFDIIVVIDKIDFGAEFTLPRSFVSSFGVAL